MAWICGAKRGKAAARPIPTQTVAPASSEQLSPPSRRKTSFSSGLLATDRTALENNDIWNAAEKGNLDVLRRYLPEDLQVMNKHHDTLLHYAAARGQAETVLFLIQQLGAASVNAVNVYQETPLHRAASLGKADVVRALIASGADVNLPNSYEETPFYIACYGGHTSVVEQLLSIPRCRYRESGENNLRPVALAGVRGHAAIVRLITRHELWRLHRLLWLGHVKGRPDNCAFSFLSHDLVMRVARFVTVPRAL